MIWTPNDMMMMSLKRKMEALIHFKRTWLSQYIMAKFHFSLWRRFCFRDKRFFFLFNTWASPEISHLDKSELMSPIISLIFFLSSCAVQLQWLIWGDPWAQRETVSFMGRVLSQAIGDLYAICAENLRYQLLTAEPADSSRNRKNSLLLRDQGHYDVHITGHKKNYMRVRQPSFYSFIRFIHTQKDYLIWYGKKRFLLHASAAAAFIVFSHNPKP